MFSNLTYPENLKMGISPVAYLAPLNWFQSLGRPEPPFDAPGKEVTIYQSHQFKPGKGFLEFLLAPQKNKLDAKMTGDLGNNFFLETAEIFVPGSYKEVHETIKNLMNIPLIVLLKDCNCPEEWFYNIGCDCISCWLTADFSTAATKDGAKGYTVTLTTSSDAVYYYAGDIAVYTGQLAEAPANVMVTEDNREIITEDNQPILVDTESFSS